MLDGQQPYIVPLCFGYRDNTLYFHSALKGHKIDLLEINSNVCFEFDRIAEPVESDKACNWSMKYQSVIGYGKAVLLDDPDEKCKALAIILAQYSDKTFEFPENEVKATAVIKVDIVRMTAKQSADESFAV